jgi:hypothetical protein
LFLTVRTFLKLFADSAARIYNLRDSPLLLRNNV